MSEYEYEYGSVGNGNSRKLKERRGVPGCGDGVS